MTRGYMRVVILTIALGLLVVPTVITQSSLNIDKPLSYNTIAGPYRERGEIRVDPTGHIGAWASVEGAGVYFRDSHFDYSGPEWGEIEWIRANARQSRDPNEENVWVDLNFATSDLRYAEDVANAIMMQINDRMLQDWFNFRGSDRWNNENDLTNPSDDVEMVSVYYGGHIDFPWFVDELDASLPREMGGLAANIDVTDADEAWFQIYRSRDEGPFSTQYYQQLGVGFNSYVPNLEGGHELVMEDLLHLSAIERSRESEDTSYWFNLPDVDNLSSNPTMGDYEGYSVYENRWYEGGKNEYRQDSSLNIHDSSVSIDSFKIIFDYQFRPRALQTIEEASIRIDPFGNLQGEMELLDPSATLTSIDYNSDIYQPVDNIQININRPEESTAEASPPARMLAGQVIRSEPNIHLQIQFESDDPMYADLADEIVSAHGADLGVEIFRVSHEDRNDGRYRIGYNGWVDWNLIVERAENPELTGKSSLYNAIDFASANNIDNYINFEKWTGQHRPIKHLGVSWWINQYMEGAGEHIVSTQVELGYVPLHMQPEVDQSRINIDVPGNVLAIMPPKETWGNGFDVYHNQWDDNGIPMNNYNINIFDSDIELAEFAIRFEFEFFDEGSDIWAPDIQFRNPYQGEFVSDDVQVEVEIWDDMSGVDPTSVVFEVSPYPLLNEWTELEIHQEFDGTWMAQWDTTEHGDGTYRLLVRARDYEGHEAEAEISVDVDNYADSEPPEVEIITPNHGDVVSGDVTVIAEVYAESGLERVGITIDGSGYIMQQISEDEWSYTWDSTKRADGEHLIWVIAYAIDGTEGKTEIVVISDNDVTSNVRPSETGDEAAFFIPGFSLLEVLMALGCLGLLVATRRRRHA